MLCWHIDISQHECNNNQLVVDNDNKSIKVIYIFKAKIMNMLAKVR